MTTRRTVGALLDVLHPHVVPIRTQPGGMPGSLDHDVEISGLSDDSRTCEEGCVFFARRGSVEVGSKYAREAVDRGAILVVTDAPLAGPIPHLVVSSVQGALIASADYWFDHPIQHLKFVGITGTKGKTTTAHLVTEGLHAFNLKPAMIGTIQHDLGDGDLVPATNTTPGVLELRALLSRAIGNGCNVAVLEVSSHALDQGRTEGIQFDVAVLTNLTSDHLDYHRTLDAYRDAKGKLFTSLSSDATAVLNHDDPAWKHFALLSNGTIITYGQDASSDVRATNLVLSAQDSTFDVTGVHAAARTIRTHLVGRHNVSNVLAAIATVKALEPMMPSVPLIEFAVAKIESLGNVRGRLERVEHDDFESDIHVFVDYAHTEDALKQVLQFLRGAGAHPLTVVVGCGGDRDKTKRPRMARVATEIAHTVVFTSDNPRSEDPRAILNDMVKGLDELGDHPRARILTMESRHDAIQRAILEAPSGSTVLVAGKGHETYQVVGDTRLPFCDVTEVRRALRMRATQPQSAPQERTTGGSDELAGDEKNRRDGAPPRDSEV